MQSPTGTIRFNVVLVSVYYRIKWLCFYVFLLCFVFFYFSTTMSQTPLGRGTLSTLEQSKSIQSATEWLSNKWLNTYNIITAYQCNYITHGNNEVVRRQTQSVNMRYEMTHVFGCEIRNSWPSVPRGDWFGCWVKDGEQEGFKTGWLKYANLEWPGWL